MSFFRAFSPLGAIRDFGAFVRRADRDHVIGATLALLVTGSIVVIIMVDSKVNTSPGRSVTYVELYESDRTDEEIVARQKADQEAIEARAKERQEQFKKVDDALERAGL
ncbi:hypothetical protein WJS89_07940 [Sphingomicrobium sp. XHP0235]|uniref:hypothetical protein n=1 Tax=Sphingomicrobium aquimarinum TaxID=3133971 RepID=UPI0031FF35C3